MHVRTYVHMYVKYNHYTVHVIKKFPLRNYNTNISKYLQLRYYEITIMIRRDNDHSVFRIYQNYDVLHKKTKVLVCDMRMYEEFCKFCFAITSELAQEPSWANFTMMYTHI